MKHVTSENVIFPSRTIFLSTRKLIIVTLIFKNDLFFRNNNDRNSSIKVITKLPDATVAI